MANTTKRYALAGLAAVVLALVAFVVISASTGSDGDARPVPGAAAVTPDTTGGEARVGTPNAPRPAPAPEVVDLEPEPELAAPIVRDDGVVEYTRDDGTVVRDHRREVDKPPVPRPIADAQLLELRLDLRPIVKDCAQPIRARDSRLRGQLQARLRVSVTDGTATVEEAELSLTGLEDDEFLACVKRGFDGATLAMPEGQDDVDSTFVTMPFKVP